jgi:hypothetical protein
VQQKKDADEVARGIARWLCPSKRRVLKAARTQLLTKKMFPVEEDIQRMVGHTAAAAMLLIAVVVDGQRLSAFPASEGNAMRSCAVCSLQHATSAGAQQLAAMVM